ncbi:MAG TPA: 2-oxoglutarate dehydrogenase, E2 component, dihydrolipoamide succinyltransferase, partial [Casimicrobiaceae bacterium]|nr:2-oxoglutarate dehydrogenase, E2 component, dihydrolipoamide succinyltransferase [Casimicrobiaceae bacterium]
MRTDENYSGAAIRIAAAAAALAAAAVLAAVAARWGWQAFGPAPVHIAPAAPASPAAAIVASGLLGAPAASAPA